MTTDAENRAALTFEALGKSRILDILVQDEGGPLGYVETKYGPAAAIKYYKFQAKRDVWLRQNLGLTIDVVFGG